MPNRCLKVASILGFAAVIGCKSVGLSGQNPIGEGQRAKPTPPPLQTNQPQPPPPPPQPNQPNTPNPVSVGFIGGPIAVPQTPVVPMPNFPVIRWEPQTISRDPSKGTSPLQLPPPANEPPITAEPPPPATNTEACRSDVLAANSAIVLQGQSFQASARATSLRGVKTSVSAFTSIVVTLDNGKTYSSNNIFAAIVRNGKPVFNVSRGYSDTGAAWYEVAGYRGVLGQIIYSGNSATLNLMNGACVVQYGAANGGYPYLVLP